MNALEWARQVFSCEANAIAALGKRVDEELPLVVDIIANCRGRVVFFGVGKSGIVAKKVAATMASLGIPAFFVHAGESHHGDVGSIASEDVVVVASYGGESQEVIGMLPVLQRIGARLVAITGKPDSTVGRAAEHVLDVGLDRGTGMIGWAHLSSIAATMAMGDALAIAAAAARGLTRDEFALYHPGGSYGKELRQEAAGEPT
jgi:arabinose-5-phosphate isomerase